MKKILIQLDTDPQPSVFDRVVAIDSGADELFSYGGVTPDNVRGLVHGAMFTRGPKDLCNTAIFVGGSKVADAEAVMSAVQKVFFQPLTVSVMADPNGSNTTAAAAILAALNHLDPTSTTATIFGGTGPVGQRAAQILSGLGATVRVVSRSQDRAAATCQRIGSGKVEPVGADNEDALVAACDNANLVLAAGAEGVQFLSESARAKVSAKVFIDVNAVPPVGIEGVGVLDRGKELGDAVAYGALGVGGTKMKIHKAAIARLFTSNDLVLDTGTIFELGRELTTT